VLLPSVGAQLDTEKTMPTCKRGDTCKEARMIDDIVTGLIGGLLGERLKTLARPRKTSAFDSIPAKTLKQRNNWIDVAGRFIYVGSYFVFFAGLLYFGLGGNLWRVALVFFFPETLALVFVGAATLPHGIKRWHEFWRFHEIKQRSHLYLLLALYIPMGLLGLVSAIMVFL
jgi:hypothetical protein